MDKTEFFIVGNGLAGTMLAFEMLEHNLDFRIISSPQKKRATEVAAGMFNPLVFKRLTKSWLADELLPIMKQKYKGLERLLGKQFFFEKDILKPLSAQEKLLWLDRKSDPAFSKYILSVRDSTDMKNLAEAPGYGRVKGSGYVDLKIFLDEADLFFKSKNLVINGLFDFSKVNPAARNFNMEGVNASKIVFCEGPHIMQNPFFPFVKIVPVKGEVLQVHIPDLSEEFILNKKCFVLPLGNQRFKVGSTYDWQDLSWQPTENGRRSITERMQELILAEYHIEHQVGGIRPAASDRRPALGIHPEYKNLTVFNGLGTKGVMLAPFFAHEMLKILTVKSYAVNSEVDVNRFL